MDKDKTDKKPLAVAPEEMLQIKIKTPKKVAGGIPAVTSSLNHIRKEMDLKRGAVMFSLNQKGGIDCPGCAWPDPDDERSVLGEYCENGAKAIAEEATTKCLDTEFFKNNSVYDLSLLSDYELGKKGRIAQPMYLAPGASHYQEIGWEEAFSKIGKQLNSLDSPDEAIFYTSGRTSNETAYLYQLFVRTYGTNNLPDCSNMCHESSGVALSETVGIGKGSVTLEDFEKAEVIVIMGQNPGTNHPRMLSALEKAKKKGAKIISVNPLKEAGLMGFSHPQKISSAVGLSTALTDLYLQVKLNGDMALLQAISHVLLTQKNSEVVIDQKFIQEKCEGYEAFVEHIKKQNLPYLLEIAGITKEQIQEAATMLSEKTKIIICWAMGLTQHKNAVNTIKEAVNLLLLKGSIGKPGAGTCPVRGHSNVQGDRTVGIHEKPPARLLDALDKRYHIQSPRKHGYNVVEAIQAMHNGKAKVFFAMGGNFLSATPDTHYTAEALENCSMTIQVSTKLNRSHLVTGREAIILPCLARTDIDVQNNVAQFMTVENSMGVVHTTQGKLKPISDKLLSETEIVIRLAGATLIDNSIPWNSFKNNYDLIRDEIEACIPGFEDYNIRVRQPGGFYLPNGARDGTFDTPNKKANFTVSHAEALEVDNGEYLMMTVRSHDQFNTTIYGLDDRYRGIYNERRVVLIHPDDMEKEGLYQKAVVDIYNNYDGKKRIAHNFIVIPYSIPRGCIATYFPEANVLIPADRYADKSHTPISKSVRVRIALSRKENIVPDQSIKN